LEPWDAILCTSRAVRESMQTIIDESTEFLRERVGATQFASPPLPIIPLGVAPADFAITRSKRDTARQELKIQSDEIVVLFVARLSFHGKAHPAAMYKALELCAAEGKKVVLLQAGWFA